jgi:subtilisin family serine protease
MSLGFGFDENGDPVNPSIVADAVQYAHDREVLMVAAAGNDGEETVCDDGQCVNYPAAYSEVIAVSALMNNDDIAPFSNRGSEIEFGAPGGGDADGDGTSECPNEMIYSTVPTETEFNGNTYSYLCYNGTSMASPHVAAVAALVKATEPGFTKSEIRTRLGDTAADVGLPSDEQGKGLIDAAAAVELSTGSISVDATGESNVSPGGTATINISALELDEITVRKLWTDWTLDSQDPDNGTVSSAISSSGQVTISYSSVQDSAAPSITVSLPDRYVGGEFVVTVEATNPANPTA